MEAESPLALASKRWRRDEAKGELQSCDQLDGPTGALVKTLQRSRGGESLERNGKGGPEERSRKEVSPPGLLAKTETD